MAMNYPIQSQVSCVIPLYNKRHSIARALDSVLAQGRFVAEVLVVDDGSTDGSAEVVDAIAARAPTIRLIRQANAGPARARNRGVAEAAFSRVCFLDADDVWRPNFGPVMSAMLQRNPDAPVLSVGHAKHGGPGYRPIWPKRAVAGRLIRRPLRAYRRDSGLIHSSTACVQRRAFLEAGGFCEQARRGEDIALWLVLFARHALVHATTICVDRYVSAGATARTALPHHLAYWPPRLESLPPATRGDMGRFLRVSALKFWALALRQDNLSLAQEIVDRVSVLSATQAAGMRITSGALRSLIAHRAHGSTRA